jgi:hypothetical protein
MGDPSPRGETRIDRDGEPTPSRQLTSQAKRAASRCAVLRPSFRPTPSQRVTGRNLALDLVAAVGAGVTIALVNALLPTIARRGGLEPLGLSALAAAPFVANFLGAFAGRFGPRSTRELALVRGLGAASLVLLFVAPVPAVMILVSILSGSASRSVGHSTCGCGVRCTPRPFVVALSG